MKISRYLEYLVESEANLVLNMNKNKTFISSMEPAHELINCTVRNEEYLIKAGNHFKTIPHYKVTNSARIQMKYIYGYFEK